MSKYKTKTWHLNDPVYEVWVHVRVGKNLEDFGKYLKKYYKRPIKDTFKGDINMGAYCGDIVSVKNGQILGYCIWIHDFDWTIDCQATTIHELFHLVNRILERRGIYDDVNTDEPHAYYLSYWMKRLWRLFKIYR